MTDDAILLSLLQKQLDHIAMQMGWVMTRTARSPIFSQAHDFSCFVADSRGSIITQADGLPIHTGGGGFAVRALLERFESRIEEGDVFVLNDPYTAGNNHLPDWTIIRPVIIERQLCGFACNRAHQSDIGGGAAGTYNAAATEIFHEGIRLPPLRLVERGEIRGDLWQLLLVNSRCPDLLDGDLRAMIGSTQIGGERLARLAAEMTHERFRAYLNAILSHGERMMQTQIRRLPKGTYFGEDGTNTDCFGPADIKVRVRIDVADDELFVDFTGSDPQARGFKNSSLANTHSAVYVAVGAFFDASLPRNEGSYRPIHITAPPGTVVNASYPAAMTMNTVYPAGEIVHACWKALAQADPARACAGWGKVVYCVTSGRTYDGRTYVMYHWHGSSGGGAVSERDGFNAIGQIATLGGMTLPNAEAFEQIYPVVIRKQEFRVDGGGPGQHRGGTGIDYEVDVEASAQYSFRGEGLKTTSGFGISGGGFGQAGAMDLRLLDGNTVEPPQYGLRDLGPLKLRLASPGGGGWGDPTKRDPDAVLRDVQDGLVSVAAARESYRVVISANLAGVDELATTALRTDR